MPLFTDRVAADLLRKTIYNGRYWFTVCCSIYLWLGFGIINQVNLLFTRAKSIWVALWGLGCHFPFNNMESERRPSSMTESIHKSKKAVFPKAFAGLSNIENEMLPREIGKLSD